MNVRWTIFVALLGLALAWYLGAFETHSNGRMYNLTSVSSERSSKGNAMSSEAVKGRKAEPTSSRKKSKMKKKTRPCRDDSEHCADWALSGECENNPKFMLRRCRLSCNVCSVPVSPWKMETWSDGPQDLLHFLGDKIGTCDLPRVDYREFESPEAFFERYRNQAVLIEHALDNVTMGPDVWTKDHFLDVFGAKTIELRDSYAFAHLGPNEGNIRERGTIPSMSMRSFINQWTVEDVEGIHFSDGPPGFVFKYFHEVPSPSMMRDFRGTAHTRNLVSLGRAGSGITFHDHHESWLGVVHGSKHWYLYGPHDLPHDASHANLETAQLVLLNPTEWMTRLGVPSLRAFFDKASSTTTSEAFRRPLQCTQNAGELMWLPHYWWHATVNLVDTLSFGGQNHGIPDQDGDTYRGVGLTNNVMETWDIRSLQEETNQKPWTKYPHDWRERIVALQRNANYQLGKYMPAMMTLLESAERTDGWNVDGSSWFWDAIEPMLADIHFLTRVNIMDESEARLLLEGVFTHRAIRFSSSSARAEMESIVNSDRPLRDVLGPIKSVTCHVGSRCDRSAYPYFYTGA